MLMENISKCLASFMGDVNAKNKEYYADILVFLGVSWLLTGLPVSSPKVNNNVLYSCVRSPWLSNSILPWQWETKGK